MTHELLSRIEGRAAILGALGYSDDARSFARLRKSGLPARRLPYTRRWFVYESELHAWEQKASCQQEAP